jgi:ubiquinone/menaquinone biosynthesis C-methylase UbiE
MMQLHDATILHDGCGTPPKDGMLCRRVQSYPDPLMAAVDYDSIAQQYDQRYRLHGYPGIRSCLERALVGRTPARVLELGCGSGRWLAELSSINCDLSGLDPSANMLALAATKSKADLKRGVAEAVPWVDGSFDVVFCVNALHHFSDPSVAIAEAFRVLRPGGLFISIGLDPHESRGRWYVYEFFPETLAADRARFASASRRLEWLHAAGFAGPSVELAEHLVFSHTFEEAHQAGVLAHSFTSQLTALTTAEYEAGLDRLRRATADDSLRLETDLVLYATRAERAG